MYFLFDCVKFLTFEKRCQFALMYLGLPHQLPPVLHPEQPDCDRLKLHAKPKFDMILSYQLFPIFLTAALFSTFLILSYNLA